MKIIDILPIININTKIQIFVDDNSFGVFYKPISAALKTKYYLNIDTISVNNNILIIKAILK